MSQAEELSTMVYRGHREKLIATYEKQINMMNWISYINPYIAIKNISMALSGTDFQSFRNFDLQAEAYRYDLAQTMNELQMKYISNSVSNSSEKGAVISNQFWKDYPEFNYKFLNFSEKVNHLLHSFASLTLWVLCLLSLMLSRSNKLSAY